MTVKELIEKLQQYDPEYTVMASADNMDVMYGEVIDTYIEEFRGSNTVELLFSEDHIYESKRIDGNSLETRP